MPQIVMSSGLGGAHLSAAIVAHLRDVRPAVVGIASAFVSVGGVEWSQDLLTGVGARSCRLIAGLDYEITHPRALALARDGGWRLRLGNPESGVFHPKMIVAGDGFDHEGNVVEPCFAYVGSANLTTAGLGSNADRKSVV